MILPSGLPASRRLLLETMFNVRDLGGYPTRDGSITSFGKFIRADAPFRLNEHDLQTLLQLPVTTVIDLRSPSENNQENYRLNASPDVDYFNIPLLGFDMMASIMAMNDSDDPYIAVPDLYIRMLEKAQEPIGDVITRLARAKSGACLFHCTHGKDRTGIIAALLLMLASVRDQDIIADYQVSATYLKPWFDTFIQGLPAEIMHFFRTEPENMEKTLEYFHQNYRSVDQYLNNCGVDASDIARLRQKLFGQDPE